MVGLGQGCAAGPCPPPEGAERMMEPVARAKVNSSVLRRSDAPHEVPELP
jgi:hypothetical protein